MYLKCAIVFVIVFFAKIWAKTDVDTIPGFGPCECGVFSGKLMNETENPIYRQNPLSITCNSFGKSQCTQLCAELARDVEVRGPVVLCAILGHSDPIRPHVYSRACYGEWIYTGMCCKHSVCCHDKVHISCLNYDHKEEEFPFEDETFGEYNMAM